MSDGFSCKIEDFGQQSSEFIGVFDGDLKRVQTLHPFGGSGVRSATLTGGGVYAISHRRGRISDGTPIALFDATTGNELARATSHVLPANIVALPRAGMVAVIGGVQEVEFRDATTLDLIWAVKPFAIITADGNVTKITDDWRAVHRDADAAAPLGHLAEGPDGVVRMPFYCKNAVGFFQIDPHAQDWRVVTLDMGPENRGLMAEFTATSPDGRWAVREGAPLSLAAHPTLTSEHGTWFVVTCTYELWDLLAERKAADITAAPQPVLIYDFQKDEVMAYLDWLNADDRPRGPFGLFGGRPKPPVRGYEDQPHKPRFNLLKGTHPKFIWEEDSAGFWIVRRYSMMRAGLDGSTGPLIFPDHGLDDPQRAALENRPENLDLGDGEVRPHGRGNKLIRSITKPQPDLARIDFYSALLDLPLPYDAEDGDRPTRRYPKLTAKDIEAQLPALIPVKAWTQEAVNAALADLQSRFADGLEKLTQGNGLTLTFKTRGAFLDEWSFFEKLHDKRLVNVPALRDLLTAWCDAQGGKQWYFTSDATRIAGPMSGALACLGRNDDACHDLLRRYCLLRDGEHEDYARDTVLLGFIQRHGLKDIETLRLAVFFVLLREHDGRFSVEDGQIVYPWAELGIPQAARALMKPQEFVQAMHGERTRFGGDPARFDDVLRGLRAALDPSLDWDATVAAAMPA